MYAIFNANNKKFLSYSDQSLDGNYLSVFIPEDQRDLMEWRWEGDFDSGKMVKIENSPYENVYNQSFFNEKYPLNLFMSILLKQLYITSKKNNILDESFSNMIAEYIVSFEGKEQYLNFLKNTNKI